MSYELNKDPRQAHDIRVKLHQCISETHRPQLVKGFGIKKIMAFTKKNQS